MLSFAKPVAQLYFWLIAWSFTTSLNRKVTIWWGFFRLSAPKHAGTAAVSLKKPHHIITLQFSEVVNDHAISPNCNHTLVLSLNLATSSPNPIRTCFSFSTGVLPILRHHLLFLCGCAIRSPSFKLAMCSFYLISNTNIYILIYQCLFLFSGFFSESCQHILMKLYK